MVPADKPGADVDGTKKALHEAGVQIEDYGGDVQAIPISALNGTGVENLIEALLLQAEMLQLSADPQVGNDAVKYLPKTLYNQS